MMQLSGSQIDCIRQHVQSTLNAVESKSIVKLNSIDYQLSILEIGIAFVLADIVEALPSPSYDDVKRLLEARERLWNECYPQEEPEA
jgi:hypothetical protein